MDLNAEKTTIFGFGAQGEAQALNLKDSGRFVSVFLRPESPRVLKAKNAGMSLSTDPRLAATESDVAALLLPDGSQPTFYREVLEKSLPKGAMLVFAHGFAIHYEKIVPRPDLDVALVAPMAQGATVRSDFLAGGGVPMLIAVAQDATGKARERAMHYARGISRGGPFIETSFAEEVETDLFAEQAVLCGGMPELVKAAFDTLAEGGANPLIAYLCCLKELRAIVSLMDEHGIAGMRDRISDTALYGALTRGPIIVGKKTREELRRVLKEIRSGSFAEELTKELESGAENLRRLKDVARRHPMEKFSGNR
ncbi:MAG TPA: ketol-acid reductoisomerase [bacterium]|nr:ketol-acid reductoisomerase [bacterium]